MITYLMIFLFDIFCIMLCVLREGNYTTTVIGFFSHIKNIIFLITCFLFIIVAVLNLQQFMFL